MTEQQTFDQAVDLWNNLVQQTFRTWCDANRIDQDDEDAYEAFCESPANAGLVRFAQNLGQSIEFCGPFVNA